MGNAAGLATVPISVQEEVKSLVTTIDTTTGSARCDALNSMYAFQTDEATSHYVPFLLHPDLKLIPIMKRILESLVDDYDDLDTMQGVLYVLNPFAAKVETAKLICSSEAKFLPVLVKLYYRKDIFDFVDASVVTMSSLRECQDYLLSDEAGYISYLKYNLVQEPPEPIVFDQIEQITRTMALHNIKRLFDAGLLALVLQQFLTMNQEKFYDLDDIDRRKMWSRCLISITRTSKLNEAARYYRDNIPNGPQEFFQAFPAKESLVHIFSIIALSNLYGKDETSSGTTNTEMNSILDRYPRTLHLFALLLEVNMDSPKIIPKELEDVGFMYGIIMIGDIAIPLKNLSVSDQNKKPLLDHADLLKSVGRAIQLFINDSPACCRPDEEGIMYYTDGGGKDYVTIENLLEFLFQLSFFYETDESLKKNFILPGYSLVDQLTAIIALPQERNLPFEAKRSALALLNRFRGGENVEKNSEEVHHNNVAAGPIGPAATETAIPSELNGYSPRHLMMSYSWAVKKDHVIALSNILKERFHCDVWRDEEGSAILPAMSGDIMEMMAEAVQKSYAVIIVVSPEYKESPNCRLEARYARAREVNGLLKIIYVMIDSQYHTRSSPRLVDGWLGAMVGSELWYPLWDSNQIEMTAKNIAERVGNNADLNKNRLFVSIQQPSSSTALPNLSSPQSAATSSYGGVNSSVSPVPARQGPDYQKAWTFLDDPKNSKFTKNPDGLIELLDDLGVYKADELAALNPEHLESIAVLLKIAPGNLFREALRLKH